jgi:class 3 adenylate cyclase
LTAISAVGAPAGAEDAPSVTLRHYEVKRMPLFMDMHSRLEGATVDDVVAAHLKDLEIQDRYNTRYVTYWFNPDAGKVFCLVDAPSREAAINVHREAHGLVADEIIEVQPGMADALMNVRQEQLPSGQTFPESGDPDPGFRTIMFTDLEGSTTLAERLGDTAMLALLHRHDAIIRECLHVHGGREVKHTGDGIMASFASVARGVECAIAIQRAFNEHNRNDPAGAMRVRIGLSAGEPIEDHADIFGITVTIARRTCDTAEAGQILATNVVRELCMGKRLHFNDAGEAMLKGLSHPVRLFDVPWQPV